MRSRPLSISFETIPEIRGTKENESKQARHQSCSRPLSISFETIPERVRGTKENESEQAWTRKRADQSLRMLQEAVSAPDTNQSDPFTGPVGQRNARGKRYRCILGIESPT